MSTSRSARRGDHDVLKTVSALVGAPVVAFVLAASLARFLPVGAELALAIAVASVVALWGGLSCLLPLAKSGRSAAAICVGLALPALAALMLASLTGARTP